MYVKKDFKFFLTNHPGDPSLRDPSLFSLAWRLWTCVGILKSHENFEEGFKREWVKDVILRLWVTYKHVLDKGLHVWLSVYVCADRVCLLSKYMDER